MPLISWKCLLHPLVSYKCYIEVWGNSSLPPLLSLLTLNNTEIGLPQLTISPLSSQKSCEEVGVRSKMATFPHYDCWRGWTDETLTAAGLFGEFWQCSRFFGKWSFCQNKHTSFPHPLYTYTREHTHLTCWLHTMAWLYLQHQIDICQSPCGAHCYSTLGHTNAEPEFSLQQILQCKEKVPMRSANMHRWPQIARKQLETDVPPRLWLPEGERRNDFSKIFRLKSSSGSGPPLN